MSAEKQHAACDECRARKIKCSGGLPTCQRCARQGIQCIYSPQRPMGRPKKRQRQDEDNEPYLQSIEYLMPPSYHQDTGFDLQNQGQYLTPDNSRDPSKDCSENVSLWDFGENGGFVDISDFQADPSLDLSTLPLTYNDPNTSTIAAPIPSGFPSMEDSCSCLGDIYIVLSELRTYKGCSFPLPLPALRKSMATAEQVLSCTQCPKDFSTASQNLHMICALLNTIGSSFRQLLKGIDQEASLAEARGEKKEFRMGEMSPATAGLHTGTHDCPVGFNIELTAPEWRGLAKKAVLASFKGQHGANGLMQIVDRLKERQHRWHCAPDTEHFAPMENHRRTADDECREPICIQMINQTRKIIEMLAADFGSDT